VPIASAVEFTVSIQQTHARFTSVRTHGMALGHGSNVRMIGGLPTRRQQASAMATAQSEGWRYRAAARRGGSKRIWA